MRPTPLGESDAHDTNNKVATTIATPRVIFVKMPFIPLLLFYKNNRVGRYSLAASLVTELFGCSSLYREGIGVYP